MLGNNDVEEREGLIDAAKEFQCEINDEPFSITLSDQKITILHHPELIDENMISNNDLIIHGHTHRFRLEKIDKCIVFNPGECAGIMKGKNKVGIINLKEIKPKVLSF